MCRRVAAVVAMVTGRVLRLRCMITRRHLRVGAPDVERRSRVALTALAPAIGAHTTITGRSSLISQMMSDTHAFFQPTRLLSFDYGRVGFVTHPVFSRILAILQPKL